MGSSRVVPFHEELLPDAVKLCVEGVRRAADRIGPQLVQPPDPPAEPVVEAVLRRYLAEPESRRAWVAVDGSELRAFAGALIERLTPDDVRYTYMPPRSLTIGATALHAVSEAAASDCYPLLLAEAGRLAETIGDARLFVNVLPGDPAPALRHRLGLRPSTVMARRPVAGWTPLDRPPGVVVRVAGPEDVEALTDLAMEEHRFHAEHTASGVSPEVPRATSRRAAAESVAAPAETNRQLVAADQTGRVLGSIMGSIQLVAEDQIQRYLLPPRYGYLGLTVVTEAVRGTGVGRTLVDALLAWFATTGVETVFLHYVADNPLSSRFWPRAGFAPHIEIYSA